MATPMEEAIAVLLSPGAHPDQRAAADQFLREASATPNGLEQSRGLLEQLAGAGAAGSSGHQVYLLCSAIRLSLRTIGGRKHAELIARVWATLVGLLADPAVPRGVAQQVCMAAADALGGIPGATVATMMQDAGFTAMPPMHQLGVLSAVPDSNMWLSPADSPPAMQFVLQLLGSAGGTLDPNDAAAALKALGKWVNMPNREFSVLQLATSYGPVMGLTLAWLGQTEQGTVMLAAAELWASLLRASREQQLTGHGQPPDAQAPTGGPRSEAEAAALQGLVKAVGSSLPAAVRDDAAGAVVAQLLGDLCECFGPEYLITPACPAAPALVDMLVFVLREATIPVVEALLMGTETEGGMLDLLEVTPASLHPEVALSLRPRLAQALLRKCALSSAPADPTQWTGLEDALDDLELEPEEFRRFRLIHARDVLSLLAQREPAHGRVDPTQAAVARAEAALTYMNVCATSLAEASADWRMVEACIFCYYAAASELQEAALPRPLRGEGPAVAHEGLMARVLEVLEMIAQQGADWARAAPPVLLASACNVVGAFARIVAFISPPFPDASLDFPASPIGRLVSVVVGALGSVDSEAADAAAVAMASLSSHCSERMAHPFMFMVVFPPGGQALAAARSPIPIEGRTLLAEGLMRIALAVCRAPAGSSATSLDALGAVGSMVSPCIEQLREAAAVFEGQRGNAALAQELANYMQIMGAALRISANSIAADKPPAYVAIFRTLVNEVAAPWAQVCRSVQIAVVEGLGEQVMPALERLCGVFRLICEGTARCCHVAAQAGGVADEPLLQHLSQFTGAAMELFTATREACVLQLALVSLPQLFGRREGLLDGALAQALVQVLAPVSDSLTRDASELQSPLTAAFLHFFTLYQTCAPRVLAAMDASAVHTSLDVATAAISTHGQHEVHSMALRVLATACTKSRQQGDASQQHRHQHYRLWLDAKGPELFRLLIAGLAGGTLAADVAPRAVDVIGPMLHLPSFRPQLQETLGAVMASPEVEALRAQNAIVDGFIAELCNGLLRAGDMFAGDGAMDMRVRQELSAAIGEFRAAVAGYGVGGSGAP